MKPIVWSYGGGTQSIAIALLIASGKLPRPEYTIFADTGREASETWEYTKQHVSPLLASVGLTIEVASHDLATVDLYSKKNSTLLVPAFSVTDGKRGKLTNWCSHEWKMRVIRRYIRSKGVSECVNWLGMSTDEVERLHPSDVKWIDTAWPLCGMPREYDYGVRMSRADCKQLILNQGWPEPPKSACWMCPNHNNEQWQRLKTSYPQDFQKAVQFEKDIQANNKTRGVLWLHESRKPLDEIDFEEEEKKQPELFGCESGLCWT